MLPHKFEEEAVTQAFELIQSTTFTPNQSQFLRDFFEQNARDPLNPEQINKIFSTQIKVRDAIKILHDFATHYESEDKAFMPFKKQIEKILAVLPKKQLLPYATAHSLHKNNPHSKGLNQEPLSENPDLTQSKKLGKR